MKKLLILGVVMLLLTGCNQNEEPSKNNEQNQENKTIILADQIINDLTMEDFNISTDEDNITYIYFDVVNNTENVINVNKVTYTLYEDNNKIFSTTKNIDGPIQPGDLKTVVTSIDINLSNVNRVEYVVE